MYIYIYFFFFAFEMYLLDIVYGILKKKTSKVIIQDHLFFYYLIRPLFIDYINREGKKKNLE